MKAAKDTLDNAIIERPSCKQNLCLDKGYNYPKIEREVIKRRCITHVPHRGGEEEQERLKRIKHTKDGL
jgi:hypothetical protein